MSIVVQVPQDDPEASLGTAEGPRAKTLSFFDLSMTVEQGKDQKPKPLLNNVWGSVEASSLTCIMGPSGAGKSSLLNVIAGRMQSTKTLKIDGTILVGGAKIDPVEFKRNIAYVMQDDAISPTSTVREALTFSASLRLGGGKSKDEIAEIVNKMIADLGLQSCADTFVGGELIKGISGGERKRTSIGVELITDPSLVFLDEPTSGLDSYSAYKIVELLKALSHQGRCTIMCTIHQPSSEIFLLFDNCIMLKSGFVSYGGPVSGMADKFSACGFPVPPNTNLADHAMWITQMESVDTLKDKGLIMACPEKAPSNPETLTDSSERTATTWTQFKWLLWREGQATKRDKAALIGRFGITIFLNTLFGIIFKGAGSKDDTVGSNFGDHFGAMTMVFISSMFGAAQPTLLAFPAQRPIFLREYSTGTYSIMPYVLSKIMFELPMALAQNVVQWAVVYNLIEFRANFILITLTSFALGVTSASVAALLGSAVADIKTATELLPLVLVPQLLFAGFFIRTDSIPEFIRWAQHLCSLKYAMNIAILVEFDDDMCDESDGNLALCRGMREANGVETNLIGFYIGVLVVLFVAFRVGGALLLMSKAKTVF